MCELDENIQVIVTGGGGLVGKSLQKFAPKFHYLTRKDADLRCYDEVEKVFKQYRPHVVIHLASHVGGVYDNMKHNYQYLMDNTKIHMNIVEAVKIFRVRKLINILSTCIFPDSNVHYPLSSDQLHIGLPHSSNIGYAYSKRFLHVASMVMADACPQTRVINLIPTNLYGEYDQYNIERGHVIPSLIHKTYLMMKNDLKTLKIRGSGNARRQFLYSDDFSKIILHFTKFDMDHHVLCIASPPSDHEVSIRELMYEIVSQFGGDETKIQFDITEDEGQYLKTTSDLELKTYIPDFEFTSLQKGLENVISFFQNNYELLRK